MLFSSLVSSISSSGVNPDRKLVWAIVLCLRYVNLHWCEPWPGTHSRVPATLKACVTEQFERYEPCHVPRAALRMATKIVRLSAPLRAPPRMTEHLGMV